MDLGLDRKVDTQSVHVKQAIESVHSELDDFHGDHVAAVASYSTVVPRYSSCQIMHQHMRSVCESATAGINFQGFDAFKLTLLAGHACSCCGGATVFPASIWPGVSREPSHGEGRWAWPLLL